MEAPTRRRIIVAAAAAGAVAVSSVTGYLVVHREPTEPQQYSARPTRFYEIPATRRLRYQAVYVNHDGWDGAAGLDATIHKVKRAMIRHTGQGFQLKPPGQKTWGPKRILPSTLTRLRHALAKTRIGLVWRIRPVERRRLVWRSRKIDIDPAIYAPTEGTRAIDIVVGSTIRRFPKVALLGIYTCRYIQGSSSLSQHAFGNAVDWGGSPALLDSVAKWQYMMARRGWLPLAQLLWRGHDWFSGGGVYDHFNHIHDSGKPMLSGGCRRPGLAAERPSSPIATWPFEGDEGEDEAA